MTKLTDVSDCLFDEDDCVACNFDHTFMSDLFKQPLPAEGFVLNDPSKYKFINKNEFVKVKPEVKMVRYYENKRNGDVYVLNFRGGEFRTVNIETGGAWSNGNSISFVTNGLTEIKGEVTFKKKTQHLKSAQDIMKILVDDGYKVNSEGYWTKLCERSFIPKFWQYCGQKNPGFILDESWMEYK